MRIETRSEFIVGNEKLEMTEQRWDPDASNYGKILCPPVLTAQTMLIMENYILNPLKIEVLKTLENMILKHDPRNWFTIYLSTFILLHNASLFTSAAAAQARKHQLKVHIVFRRGFVTRYEH